jgi:circadian clock protein KaiB
MGEKMVLRLYIAGRAPNSVRAMANLDAICREYLPGNPPAEIVDILTEPLRALEDGVLVTPTLLRLSPSPAVWIVGDLSQKSQVLLALGIE